MTMTSNLTNYHSHSLYCDGHAPIRDFLDEAVRQGFTSYGVSPHAPLPWTTRWTMLALELPVFIHEMHRLREEYKERLELYCGLEIDHIDQDINPQAGIFKNLTLDYKIGSVHLIHNQAGRLVDIDLNVEKFRKAVDDSFSGDVEYVVGKYFEAQMEMARTGGFDILGHMDKISFNVESYRPGLTSSRFYTDKVERLLELATSKSYIIEVNTKAYAKQGVTFIGRAHYHLLKDMGAKVVVNSDSHYPSLINAGRMEALHDLKEAGIKEVMELHGGKWCNVAIGSV